MVKEIFMLKNVLLGAGCLGGVCLFFGVLALAGANDDLRNDEIHQYEACVRAEYHQSAQSMYSNDGYLPDCK